MKDAATLSKREYQIAEMIAWGQPKKIIASKLFISERTVENHTRTIYKKVGVSKANELSAWWFCTRYQIPITDSPIIETSYIFNQKFKISDKWQ
jgi:DNA-binding NarL/FixJ family response regulator